MGELVVRSLPSVPGCSVNRPTKHGASGARGHAEGGKDQHEWHHQNTPQGRMTPSTKRSIKMQHSMADNGRVDEEFRLLMVDLLNIITTLRVDSLVSGWTARSEALIYPVLPVTTL